MSSATVAERVFSLDLVIFGLIIHHSDLSTHEKSVML